MKIHQNTKIYDAPDCEVIQVSSDFVLCASKTSFGNEDFLEEDYENIFGKMSI